MTDRFGGLCDDSCGDLTTLEGADCVHIRYATRDDAVLCNTFYNKTYGRHRTMSQWLWEFCDTSDGPSGYVLAESDDGNVVGIQGLIPIDMLGPEGRVRTGKSEDTLVDPSLRGQGVFPQLYSKVFDYARDKGVRTIWGFTPAAKAFERVGFTVVGNTAQLLFPLTAGAAEAVLGTGHGAQAKLKRAAVALAARLASVASCIAMAISRTALSGRPRSGVRIETALSAPAIAGEITRRFVEQWGGMTIARDAEYLDWRVFRNPYCTPVMRCIYTGQDLVGWAVYSVGQDGMGYIIDVVVAEENRDVSSCERLVCSLLADAVEQLRYAGAPAVRFWDVTDHPFNRLIVRVARRAGFLRFERGMPFVVWISSGAQSLEVMKPEEWYVTRICTEGVNG